jgi:glycosyltransferase involved in cell wall biosynthesis
MRKNVLFLIGKIDSGGVAKSFANLMNVFDCEKYNVSVWIGDDSDIFYDVFSPKVTKISDERITWLNQGPRGLIKLLLKGHFFLFLGSILRMFVSLFDKASAGLLMSKLMPKVTEVYYDLIVDYNGQHQLYYMIDKLKGRKKATFFHSDYAKWPYYYRTDKKYYHQVDYIFSISETCVNSLKSFFPNEVSKINLMENITSPAYIRHLAEETIHDFTGDLKLLSIGHICKIKGTDLAIKAAAILKDRNVKFKWYFIGSIDEDYSQLMNSLSLTDNEMIFLGLRNNPYPYLKQADIYVHPSRFEGKSVALDEAKILCRPIVVTNFSTVHDQFENRVNASICDMDPTSVANSIYELIVDKNLRMAYTKYLENNILDNSNEVNKLYKLIED